MKESLWNGYKRIDFEFEGHAAIVVFPKEANAEKNWLLRTEYFGSFVDFELEMLKRGWHLAYVANVTRWCLEEDLERKKKFADYLRQEYGLYEKCIPVGLSCGGLIATKYAAKYPNAVSALYLDAPVMNFLSCPAGIGYSEDYDMMEEFTKATGITLSDLINYREHPIDKKQILLDNNIPIFMTYGDSDTIVPYCENGAYLEKFYRENGGTIVVIGKVGCGHHPHGLEDNTPLIEFAERYSK